MVFRPASTLLTFGVGLKTTLCAGVVERDEMESVEPDDVGLELVEVEASDIRVDNTECTGVVFVEANG